MLSTRLEETSLRCQEHRTLSHHNRPVQVWLIHMSCTPKMYDPSLSVATLMLDLKQNLGHGSAVSPAIKVGMHM